ncbi:MAG TPA: aldehyde dehydrogenase family protein [Streptosporangiaceae bacterium]|jgi:acyl-CoA reductase-like NAD-dependent aldehyde dehydrogenase|nr:aldehyde dehydrogenase family protein [Streptosporangiaceae bacterium]
MTATLGSYGLVRSTETFDTLNPATNEVIGTYPVFSARDVDATVERAQAAAQWWAELGWAGRRQRLLAWKSHLTRYIGRLAELVHTETGKPLADAQLEILLTIVHVDWAARHARRVLHSRRVRSGLVAINQAATLEYQPLGVVGVIGPWNYPVFTPMGSIAYALAAGNGVVFKPSELTPAVGAWLVSSFAEVVPEQPVLQLITGMGETGDHLARSGVAKIAFTGSAATARKVMAACAENLTPMVAECGGKDAFIVAADADLDAAADACAWGALSNAGQTCVGVERVYVVQDVYHQFLEKLTERVTQIRPGDDREADYGPMTLPGQTEVIERHISDALARGARPVVGGIASIRRPYVGPVILADVPEDAAAVTEETFGPTITVAKVASLDEGVERANASRYGLGSTVFAGSSKAAMGAARSLRSGMTAINSVISFASVPSLPFGGSGDSGFGRIHGADGLREFARPKSIARQRMKPLVSLTSFSRTDQDMKKILNAATMLHGRRYK